MEQQKKRCVVYTRKSHEEGLDQAFNSLDAQRQACESYIQSQQFNGWELMPKRYDDGGFSGGTLERPALKELLADIEAGEVDVVVIYKIDRLSRSLVDFAELFHIILEFLNEYKFKMIASSDEIDNMVLKFTFALASQDFYPDLI